MKKLALLLVAAFALSANAQVFQTYQVTATAPIGTSANTGAYGYGTLSYMDTNIIEGFQGNANSYVQNILQNTNAGATASTDYVVSNNQGTATTFYGNFGMNSSGFAGTGAFNAPNVVYLTGTSGDLAIGTTTSNAIHFVANGAATDAITISSSNIATLNSPVLVTPALGTPASGVITNLTGTCTSCTASNATTAVNLSGGTVSATTIAASGLISPANTIGVKGTTLSTTTQAGSIGETMTATGTAVNLAVSGTVYQIATISPTAGHWDIFSECYFTPAATTTTTLTEAGVNTTTAVLPAVPLYTVMPIALAANTPIGYALPTQRVLLSATTPYYVNASAAFATSTITATCTITAVRTD
jgi:hypothetical protein